MRSPQHLDNTLRAYGLRPVREPKSLVVGTYLLNRMID